MKQIQGKQGFVRDIDREVPETEGSRNRNSTVFMSLNLLFKLSTRNGAIINKNSQAL